MIYRNLDHICYEEAIYEGHFKNNKREGFGEMKWMSGKEEFKGYWTNDQRIRGTMKMRDGN